MSAPLLELPTFRRLAAPLSVEEYHLLGQQDGSDRRTELLRGFIVEKMVPSPFHTALVRRLSEFAAAVAEPGTYVRREDPLTLADSEPQPDVAVVTGDMDDYTRAHPSTALLVMEVALSTEERDRAKANLYAEAGIPEFWLVLPERALVEVHLVPRDGLYTQHQTHRVGDTLTSTTLPRLHVELATLFRA